MNELPADGAQLKAREERQGSALGPRPSAVGTWVVALLDVVLTAVAWFSYDGEAPANAMGVTGSPAALAHP